MPPRDGTEYGDKTSPRDGTEYGGTCKTPPCDGTEYDRAFGLNPLVLAFVGDAAFSLRVRASLAAASDAKAGKLHLRANKFVSARGQAEIYDGIYPAFTECERDVARRARNCENNTKSRRADLETYKKATSFEAVIGYLYLSGQTERLDGVFALCGLN